MAYRSVLTVATVPDGLTTLLRAASAFAQSQDGHLEVLVAAVDLLQPSYHGYAESFSMIEAAADDALRTAQATEAVANAHLQHEDPALRWSVEVGGGQFGNLRSLVAHYAMFSDIVVLAQPYGPGIPQSAEVVLETVLFDSLTPVLILPRGDAVVSPSRRHIAIGWDQSREAMAAVRRALPLLISADKVDIVVIDPPVLGAERSDHGGRLCQMLVRHGVRAEVSVLVRSAPRISDVLLRHLSEQGADLLVMGAYSHSRLREAILGGVTRDLLELVPIPILLAH